MKKTGLQTFARLVHTMCRLFLNFGASIQFVIENSTSLTSQQKTDLLGAMNAVRTACTAIDAILTTYEV